MGVGVWGQGWGSPYEHCMYNVQVHWTLMMHLVFVVAEGGCGQDRETCDFKPCRVQRIKLTANWWPSGQVKEPIKCCSRHDPPSPAAPRTAAVAPIKKKKGVKKKE